MRFLARLQPLALLVMRLSLGAIMAAHGYQKVTNIQRTMGMLSKMGIPTWMAYLNAYGEFLGGILVLIGLLTSFAALVIVIDLVVAIAKAHWSHGLTGQGGYEFPLACATLAFALIFFGAGPLSIDRAIFKGGSRPRKSARA
ncbi:MAG TPA: DoxX family protein [Terriglobales bacterium]|nr:DoxX family protein [Terriglobales bacterium]